MARKLASKLDTGANIALIAPAFQFDATLMEKGRAFLESQYSVKATWLEDVFDHHAYFAGSDERRMQELFHWLTSPEAHAIVGIRGGYGCARIYPALVQKLKSVKKTLKPKILVGYSDMTILLNGLLQDLGWVTFHGPVVAGRAIRSPNEIESKTFHQSLFTTEPLGEITDPQMSVLATGEAKGVLVGGCLSILVSTLGTPYEIKTKDKILFLEDVDEKPYRIDRMLTQLLHAGKLDAVKGIVFGQMVQCDPAPESRDPHQTTAIEAIEMALAPLLEKRKIPVVYNFPAGHGNPQVTFPIGVNVQLIAPPKGAPYLIFLEAGVR